MDHERAIEKFKRGVISVLKFSPKDAKGKTIDDVSVLWICTTPFGFRAIAEVSGVDGVLFNADYSEEIDEMNVHEYRKGFGFIVASSREEDGSDSSEE